MKKWIPLFVFTAGAWAQPPQCTQGLTVYATGRAPALTNKTQGCNTWTFQYWTANAATISIEIDGANDSGLGVPGAWTAISPVMVGSNPSTLLTGLIQFQAYAPFLSVNITALTSSGSPLSVSWTLFGASGMTAKFLGSGGLTIPVGSAGVTRQYIYDPTGGPCIGGVVQPSSTVQDAMKCASSGAAIEGVCIAGCGASAGIATVAIEGAFVNCVFDSATTIRDQVVADIALQGTAPVAWNCYDPGSGALDLGATTIGRVLETHGAPGTYPIAVHFAPAKICNGVGNSTLNITNCASNLTFSTATNCSSSASPAVCGSAVAGSVVVAAGATTVQVNTTQVFSGSQILLTFDSSLGTKLSVTCNTTEPALYGVSARTNAANFTITATASAVNPACFSYLIVN
jgi:hypothetical protein